MPLLRVPSDGQTVEQLRTALSQHYFVLWLILGQDAATTPIYRLEQRPSLAKLVSFSPALVRPCGDFDVEGARLNKGVWIVHAVELTQSGCLELDMCSPDGAVPSAELRASIAQ